MKLVELQEVVQDACMHFYKHEDDDGELLTRVMHCIATQQALPPFLRIYLLTNPRIKNETQRELVRMIEDVH